MKGECTNDKCLLSHAVNFSKMPVCKFYLQGCCSKTDCPYLHKKLNDKVSICEDFLKGYCLLANKVFSMFDARWGETQNKLGFKYNKESEGLKWAHYRSKGPKKAKQNGASKELNVAVKKELDRVGMI